MTSKEKAKKFGLKVFDRMFRKVGFKKFDQSFIDDYKEDWFTRKTWSQDQQDEFHLYFLKVAQSDLKVSKRWAERQFQWFNLNYGWKVI